jgi:hypothetical protein
MASELRIIIVGPDERQTFRTVTVDTDPTELDNSPGRAKAIVENFGPGSVEVSLGDGHLRVGPRGEWVSAARELGPIVARAVAAP